MPCQARIDGPSKAGFRRKPSASLSMVIGERASRMIFAAA
jgi:hypothetical protein